MISTLDKSVKSSENKARLNQSVGVQEVGTKFFSESSKILLTSRLFPVQSLNTEHRTQNTEHRTQNTEHRTQNSELRTQNTEHRTQNTEHRTQNSELRTQNSELRTQSLELGAWSLEFGSWTIDLSGIRKPARNFSTGGFLVGFLRLNPFIIKISQQVLGVNKVKGGF